VLIPRTEYGPINGINYAFAWSNDVLQAYLLSDVGKKRKNNEDSCILCAPADDRLAEERGILFGVADGMGGASAGEYASRMALCIVAETYYSGPLKPIPAALNEAVGRANERIFDEADLNPAFAGMGTTVSAMAILGDWMYAAQVGDSRIYLLRERSGLHQVTRDHSLVAEQVRDGVISEAQARNHSLKNLITRAVGIKKSVTSDLFALRLKRGDTLMLCSDGLCNMVNDHYIADALALGDVQTSAHRLIERALLAGGTDNITVAIVRVDDTPTKSAYQEGAEAIDLAPQGILKKIKGLFA
jgi:serine/threonine protein phosphatase PrpC